MFATWCAAHALAPIPPAPATVEGCAQGDLVIAVGALIKATKRLLGTVEKIGQDPLPDEQEGAQPDAASDPAPYFDERR